MTILSPQLPFRHVQVQFIVCPAGKTWHDKIATRLYQVALDLFHVSWLNTGVFAVSTVIMGSKAISRKFFLGVAPKTGHLGDIARWDRSINGSSLEYYLIGTTKSARPNV